MAADRHDTGYATFDGIRNVQQGGVCKAGICFERDFFDAIALALDRTLVGELEVPLSGHEVVDAEQSLDLLPQAVALLLPFLARSGQRQRPKLLLDERAQHVPGFLLWQ